MYFPAFVWKPAVYGKVGTQHSDLKSSKFPDQVAIMQAIWDQASEFEQRHLDTQIANEMSNFMTCHRFIHVTKNGQIFSV